MGGLNPMNRNDPLIFGTLLVLGVVGLLTGAFAFISPTAFFETFAAYTGTSNLHLTRDVGAAYLAAGGGLAWAAFMPKWRAPLVSISAIFLALHAFAHLLDLASGQVPLAHLLADLVQVLSPAAVACGLAVYFLRNEVSD
jgi:hypothetical protein